MFASSSSARPCLSKASPNAYQGALSGTPEKIHQWATKVSVRTGRWCVWKPCTYVGCVPALHGCLLPSTHVRRAFHSSLDLHSIMLEIADLLDLARVTQHVRSKRTEITCFIQSLVLHNTSYPSLCSYNYRPS